MNLKRFILVFTVLALVTVIVFSWGCQQNQPTAPQGIGKTVLSAAGDCDCGTCSWYGFNVPACCTQTTNWGWEDGGCNRTCVGCQTCIDAGQTCTNCTQCGGATTTTTSGGGSTTTTSGGGGSNTIVVRARGKAGSEHIYCTVGGSEIGNWTLSTSMSSYSASTNNTGGINVCFDNDDGTNRDVQIDYITVNGSTRQAEDQSYNTGVWQDGSCGGSYSEWLHCNGCIGFGDVSGGGTTSTTTSTTTTSGGGGGEVTRSGSTWTAKVGGSTVYTGSRMFDAVNACINNMSSGTVNIRNSGDSGPGTGNIYAIKPKSNMTLDFHGCTINCNGDAYIVPVQADNKSNITVRNLKVTGNPRYGLWFRTCSNINFQSVTMNLTGGLGIRVDDSKGGWSRNLTADGINITGASNHAFETYGVDGINIGTVNATDIGYCGLLLNNSRNATIGTVNGVRCNPGGGYAAFRCANDNGPNIRVNKVYARGCGRGFFSVSGSRDCIISSVDIADCTDIGIWIQDSYDTHVRSGTVANCDDCWAITGGSGNSVNVTCR